MIKSETETYRIETYFLTSKTINMRQSLSKLRMNICSFNTYFQNWKVVSNCIKNFRRYGINKIRSIVNKSFQ
jgi:hypothetical protein